MPFNRPHATGAEFACIQDAINRGQLSGNGEYTKRCQRWLEQKTGAHKALLTHSCTGALEMAALLADVGPGDEIIMPSYTFVSTANAFVLRGAKPVFVDVQADTLNIDPNLVEAAVTPRTKAICPVHYAGVGADMPPLMDIAHRHGLTVIEDAAQGAMAARYGRPLGTQGALGALSFHETKNIIAGEGGALLINDPRLAERAEILWEKGTNRGAFFRGEIDKYTWVDVGSSFLPGELTAAFLWAQLQHADAITDERLRIWRLYWDRLATLAEAGLVQRPTVPDDAKHNAHMFYVLVESLSKRSRVIRGLKEAGFHAVFHYVPLHASPAGQRFGRTFGELRVTESLSERLIRLPLWFGIEDSVIDQIADQLHCALTGGGSTAA